MSLDLDPERIRVTRDGKHVCSIGLIAYGEIC